MHILQLTPNPFLLTMHTFHDTKNHSFYNEDILQSTLFNNAHFSNAHFLHGTLFKLYITHITLHTFPYALYSVWHSVLVYELAGWKLPFSPRPSTIHHQPSASRMVTSICSRMVTSIYSHVHQINSALIFCYGHLSISTFNLN